MAQPRLRAIAAMPLPLAQEVGLLSLRPGCSGSALSGLLQPKHPWQLLTNLPPSSSLVFPLLGQKSPPAPKVCLWLITDYMGMARMVSHQGGHRTQVTGQEALSSVPQCPPSLHSACPGTVSAAILCPVDALPGGQVGGGVRV